MKTRQNCERWINGLYCFNAKLDNKIAKQTLNKAGQHTHIYKREANIMLMLLPVNVTFKWLSLLCICDNYCRSNAGSNNKSSSKCLLN